MRILLFTGISLFIVYIFNSCSICTCKKISCPAFEDVKFETWFAAYQTANQSVFKYQSSYDTITLGSPLKNEAYEGSQGCYGGSRGCSEDFHVASNQLTTNFRQKLTLTCYSMPTLDGSETPKRISFWLMGFNCTAIDINDQGLVLGPGAYSGSYSVSLSINGTTYSNIQTITRDTTMDSTPAPFKVYLSKGAGIIAYEMFPSHELWIKQ